MRLVARRIKSRVEAGGAHRGVLFLYILGERGMWIEMWASTSEPWWLLLVNNNIEHCALRVIHAASLKESHRVVMQECGTAYVAKGVRGVDFPVIVSGKGTDQVAPL